MLCACEVGSSVSASSEELNGSNCRLALWRYDVSHYAWPAAGLLQLVGTVAPQGITEYTDIPLSSWKGLEKCNAVCDVHKWSNEINCENHVTHSIGLHPWVLKHLHSMVKFIVFSWIILVVSSYKQQWSKAVGWNNCCAYSKSGFSLVLITWCKSASLWVACKKLMCWCRLIKGCMFLFVSALREEQEKLNVWVALLNLENMYGTEETLMKVFERAVQYNEPLKVFQHLCDIYASSEKYKVRLCKHFPGNYPVLSCQ